MFEDIEHKFQKWQEPPPFKEAKPLPRPDEAPKKKRGGRRVRKMKEKSAVTELRRQANRVQFGKIEEDLFQTDIGFSMGTQAKGSGKVRAAAVDKKTQVSVSKRLQVNLTAGTLYGRFIDLLSFCKTKRNSNFMCVIGELSCFYLLI